MWAQPTWCWAGWWAEEGWVVQLQPGCELELACPGPSKAVWQRQSGKDRERMSFGPSCQTPGQTSHVQGQVATALWSEASGCNVKQLRAWISHFFFPPSSKSVYENCFWIFMFGIIIWKKSQLHLFLLKWQFVLLSPRDLKLPLKEKTLFFKTQAWFPCWFKMGVISKSSGSYYWFKDQCKKTDELNQWLLQWQLLWEDPEVAATTVSALHG